MRQFLTSKFHPTPNLHLAASSFSYILPCLVAFYYSNYITSIGCAFMVLTSVYFHTQKTIPSYLIDQCAILIIIIRSFFDAFAGTYLSILITMINHVYNYVIFFSPWRKHCTYHPDYATSTFFHSTLHTIPAIVITFQQLCLPQPLPLESAP